MGSHKAQLDWPDHTGSVPHSPCRSAEQTYFSIPGENARAIAVAHVPSDRALKLFRVHIPFTPALFFEEQVSYSRTSLPCLMIHSEGNMAESNPFQISPVWIKTASKARHQHYTVRLCLK